jgi:hypothetical protein
MTAATSEQPRQIGSALASVMLDLAQRVATSPAHHKRLLATLYEAGTINGETFAAMLELHELRAA